MARVRGLHHVVLHIRMKAVLRPEQRRQGHPRQGRHAVCDVPQLAVDRGRIGDQPHARSGQPPGRDQPFDTCCDGHWRLASRGPAASCETVANAASQRW